MIERDEVLTEVRYIIENNQINQHFLPVIEEFFIRSADQYNWTEEEFDNALKSYEKVKEIQFFNFAENPNTDAFCDYNYNSITDEIFIFMKFNIDRLKRVLRFEKDSIECFIDTAMHEQGHAIRTKKVYDDKNKEKLKFFVGLEENFRENGEWIERRIIINEFAEIINAERLHKGNISSGKYDGYEKIQTAGKIIISSLGMNEIELTDLLQKGREDYEDFIVNKLGNIPSKLYIDSFEEILDSIYNFCDDKEQRQNLISQIDSLQTLSKELFEKRFVECMESSNNNLRNLGKIIIDKENKDNALRILFDEFKIDDSELQIDEGMDIYEKLSQLGYEDDYLRKVHEIEYDERIKIQEEMDKQNEKVYDNEELIERIYQSFFRYPIKDVSLKDRLRAYIKQNVWNC